MTLINILSTLLKKALLSTEDITETALRLLFSPEFLDFCLKLSVLRAHKYTVITGQFESTAKHLGNHKSRMTSTNPSYSSISTSLHGHKEDSSTREAMSEFWREHSQAQSVEEMMLDTKAQVLTVDEQPEILSLLDTYGGGLEGKNILELGAGIGRYTADLASCAGHVTAVDFMQKFIDKNKEVNGSKYRNIEFVCADVTKLDLPSKRYDIIFSNWLLMYLTDDEVVSLAQKMLQWLREGGYLFFRESCYHQSGDKKRGANPSKYRTPQMYSSMFQAATSTEKDGESSGYELVMTKSIEAYVKHKNNKNQVCWTWQKVLKRTTDEHL